MFLVRSRVFGVFVVVVLVLLVLGLFGIGLISGGNCLLKMFRVVVWKVFRVMFRLCVVRVWIIIFWSMFIV